MTSLCHQITHAVEAREGQAGLDTRERALHLCGKAFDRPGSANDPGRLKPCVDHGEHLHRRLRCGGVGHGLAAKRIVDLFGMRFNRHVFHYAHNHRALIIERLSHRVKSAEKPLRKGAVNDSNQLTAAPVGACERAPGQ
jgi:hypothetical protein